MLKGWFISMVCGAMLVAVADTLLAGSGQRQVGRLAGAMLILLIVLRPVLGIDGIRAGEMAGEIVERMKIREEQLQEGSEEILRTIIEEQTRSYIQEKMTQMNVTAETRVECRQGENGLWLPDNVRVKGPISAQEQKELEQYIEQQLGIGPERQHYEEGDSAEY